MTSPAPSPLTLQQVFRALAKIAENNRGVINQNGIGHHPYISTGFYRELLARADELERGAVQTGEPSRVDELINWCADRGQAEHDAGNEELAEHHWDARDLLKKLRTTFAPQPASGEGQREPGFPTEIKLDAAAWDEFVALLADPPVPSPALIKLMQQNPIWRSPQGDRAGDGGVESLETSVRHAEHGSSAEIPEVRLAGVASSPSPASLPGVFRLVNALCDYFESNLCADDATAKHKKELAALLAPNVSLVPHDREGLSALWRKFRPTHMVHAAMGEFGDAMAYELDRRQQEIERLQNASQAASELAALHWASVERLNKENAQLERERDAHKNTAADYWAGLEAATAELAALKSGDRVRVERATLGRLVQYLSTIGGYDAQRYVDALNDSLLAPAKEGGK